MVNASKAQPSSLIQIGPFRRFLPRVVGLAMCGLLIATGVSVGAAGTACACSCVGYTTEEAATQADGVFVARATDKVSAGPDDIYEFAVLEVSKGTSEPVPPSRHRRRDRPAASATTWETSTYFSCPPAVELATRGTAACATDRPPCRGLMCGRYSSGSTVHRILRTPPDRSAKSHGGQGLRRSCRCR